MKSTDAPLSAAELDLWHQTLLTREEAEALTGTTDPATAAARAAFERFAGNGGRP